MDARLLLLPLPKPSIRVPCISSMPINLISPGLAEGPVTPRDCGRAMKLHVQVVLIHSRCVIEVDVHILKRQSLASLEDTGWGALGEAVQVYVFQVAPQRVGALLTSIVEARVEAFNRRLDLGIRRGGSRDETESRHNTFVRVRRTARVSCARSPSFDSPLSYCGGAN